MKQMTKEKSHLVSGANGITINNSTVTIAFNPYNNGMPPSVSTPVPPIDNPGVMPTLDPIPVGTQPFQQGTLMPTPMSLQFYQRPY
ncbi:hypothetical protein QVN42_18010 [Yersinia nurmii]|uniref:Uncharacterized protein n=1 Tax=Yersinia nurmii TaxID=685706 RepID=A0AAW7KA47_9GAMM|nr:hypothetical protein [Yersinia nurmii]MDN0089244.1 hypothetical protein [Yersinia nurmii]CNE36550.1 Uncharacterised protein [Yersinia nurmii]